MRLLQLNKYYPPYRGGIETTVRTITELLQDRAIIEVLTCNERNISEKEVNNKATIYKCGRLLRVGPMPVSISYLFKLRKVCKSADVVLLHMPFPWGDFALWLSGYKGKVALWWHSDIVRQKRLLHVYKPLLKWTLNRADVIFAATQGHISGSSFLKPYQEKCKIVPFGVKEDLLLDGEKHLVKQHDGPVRFLFVGRMVYYKGCEILVRAFANMTEKNCYLTMVGAKTELSDYCEKIASELGIEKRICFTGDVPDMDVQRYFADSDVFVLPSIYKSEAFALVQLEAMAYGIPVINTNLPSGVPWVSIDGETGITVEPMDISGLSEAMDTLARDPVLRQRYGLAGRERVERYFTMKRMKDELWKELCLLNGSLEKALEG